MNVGVKSRNLEVEGIYSRRKILKSSRNTIQGLHTLFHDVSMKKSPFQHDTYKSIIPRLNLEANILQEVNNGYS